MERNIPQIVGFHKPEEPHGCFSNWYPAEFELAGICYANSEQYMMYQKVRLGHRLDLEDMIMKTRSPAKAKEYAGKDYFPEFGSVKPVWHKICRNVVKRGVRAKFAQNPAMLEELTPMRIRSRQVICATAFITAALLMTGKTQCGRIWAAGFRLRGSTR